MDRMSQLSRPLNLTLIPSRNPRRPKAVVWAFALLFAWMLSLLVAMPAAAQTDISPSTPCTTSQNLTNLSTGSNRGITNQPVISGDGRRVAFWSVNSLGGGNSDGNIEIFVTETGSGSVVQLTDSVGSILGGFNLEPSINTAGTVIAFYSDRDLVEGQNTDGNFEIFLARRANNGSWSISQITSTQGSANLFPSINSAGDRIAFVSDDSELHNIDQSRVNSERNFEIFLATIPNSGAVQFRQITNTTAGVTNDQPVINAAGNRIAFTGAVGQTAQIYVWDESQGSPAQLTQTDINDQPSISADGTSIVYIATTSSDRSRVVLHTLSTDGSESRAEVIVPAATNTKYRGPSISGNGKRVVYVAEQDIGSAVQINVMLYDVDTGLGVPISEVGGGTGEQPAISSDGTRVTFVGVQAVGGSTDNAGSDIYINECPQADLALAFVDPPPTTVLAGVDVEYKFSVTNLGPSAADAVFFHADLSALPGLPTNVSRILPAGCTVDANDLFCPLGDLAVNASRIFTFGYDIPSNAGLTDIVSAIDVGANAVDSNDTNNATGQFTTRIFEEAALSLSVTTDRSSILAGSTDQLTYELTIINDGPSQARTARFTDTLPIGATFVSVQLVQGGGAGASCADPVGRVLSCSLGNLTTGTVTVIRIKVTADAAAGGTLTNVATVRSLTAESVLTNNTVTTQTAVERTADMAITKVVTPTTVVAGREITYTLSFTNNGFADTLNATVIDTLPPNVTYVRSIVPSGASCTPSGGGQIVTCNFPGALLVDESRTVTLTALVQSIVPAGLITNTARVLSGRGDPIAANDETPPVQSEVTLLADLVVSKTVNTTLPDIGQNFTYTVKLRNNGPSQAYSVVVTDLLPSGLTFVAATTSVGSYNDTSGLWTVGTLPVRAVGQESTLTIVARAIDSVGGVTKVNTATAGGGQPEPVPGLPSTASVTVVPQRADIQVTKSSSPSIATHAVAGKLLTYTVTITNAGPTAARSVLLTDVLPANVFLITATVPAGRTPCVTGATITCNVGDMITGTVLNYTVVVTRELKGLITNTVSVSSLTPDIVGGNNNASHSIIVDPDVPNNLIFTVQPLAFETAGAVLAPTVRVQVRDRFNNYITNTVGDTDLIRLVAFTDSSCTVPAALPSAIVGGDANAVNGEATFATLNYTRAETIYFRATDVSSPGAKAACSTAITINPDDTKKLVITTPPDTVVAGARSEAITVQRRDQYDNPTSNGAFLTALAVDSSTGRFLNVGDAQISSITIPDTLTSATFYYTDTVVGTYAITVSGGSGVTPYSQPITVVAGTASALLVVVSAPPTVTAGVRSENITIARIDDFGNENSADPTLTVTLDSDSPNPSEYEFYDETGTTIITTTAIVTGTSRTTFSYSDTRAGVRHLMFNDVGAQLAGAVMTITVVPSTTHHLVFSTTAQSVTAGVPSGVIQVAREDFYNNRTFNDANLSVTLASTSAGAPVFTPNSPVTIVQGSDHVDFQYSDTLAGVFNLTASSGLLVGASQSITVNAASANNLVVLTAPQQIIAGNPSNAITIQRRDQYGNPAPNGGNLLINLTSPSGTGQFVPLTTLTAIPSVTITQTNASFRYSDTTQGVFLLNFSNGGAFNVSQTITVTAASATKLVFTQRPVTATAGSISTIYVVERQDQFNNPNSDPSGVVVTLTTNSPGTSIGGTPVFFNSVTSTPLTSVQIPGGSASAAFRYNDTRAGVAQITADDAGALTAAITTTIIVPDVADKIAYFMPSAPAVAGVPSDVITVQVQDQYSNPVTPTVGSPVILNLTTSAAAPAEFRDAITPSLPTTQVTIGGVSSANFRYYDTKLGTPTLTATDSGTLNLGAFPQSITVVAAAAAKVRAETEADGTGTLFANQDVTAGDTLDLFAITRDQFDNFVSNPTTATWTITMTGGVTTTDITPTTGVSTTFSAKLVGTGIVVPHVTSLASVASGTLNVVAGTANKIRVESDAAGNGTLIPAQTFTAGESITVYAITRDQFDNFVGNQSATWTVISNTLGVDGGDLAGSGTSAVFTAHKVGVGGIQAEFNSLTPTPSGLLTVVAGAAVKVRAETAANGTGTLIVGQNVTAGNTLDLFAITRDQFDNFVSNPTTATWTITTTGGVTTTDISPTTGASTVFTAELVGTGIIVPHVTSLASVASGTLSVVAANATKIRVESDAAGNGTLIPAQTLTAGQSITVYAITRDQFNNFVGNQSATWTVISNTLGVDGGDLADSGTSAVFTAHKVGTGGIQATFNALTATPSGLLTVIAGPAMKVRAETAADGTGTVVTSQDVVAGQTRNLFAITRDVGDNFIGNPVTATWTITTTGGVTTTDINPLSPATGASTTFSAKLVGTGIVVPHVTNLASVPSGTLNVVASTATKIRAESLANGTGVLIPAQTITAGQSITVYAITRDQFNNFVGNPSATWTVISNTVDVDGGDLVSSGNSAVFTAHQTGTGRISATSGALTPSPSGLLTVVPGAAVYLAITNSGGASSANIAAGAITPMNIKAFDIANNLATSYTGAKTLVFSGALSSTNPVEPPRIADMNGTYRDFGVNTQVTFNNGVMSTASNAGSMRLFRAGSNIGINVVDVNVSGLDSVPSGTFTANVNAGDPYRLAITAPSPALTAGVPVSLTITAQDQYGNTTTVYAGNNKQLIFSSNNPITAPDGSVARVKEWSGPSSPPNEPFGTDTRLNFVAGVATTIAGNNGVMTVYKTGSFRIDVQEKNTLLSSSPGGTGVGYLDIVVANSPNQTISLSVTSPQTNGVPFVGTNAITLTDQYQNPVSIDAGVRPVVLTTSLNGIIGLSGSGNDNILDETNDFTVATGEANLTALGLTYTGTVGSGRITATVASPLGGFISSGANLTVNPGAPKTLSIKGIVGTSAPASDVTVAAGTPISMAIQALDVGGNVAANFTGALSLIFSSGGAPATGSIRDSANATITLGLTTTINFVSGVSSVQPNGSNGRLFITSLGTYPITGAGSGVTTPLPNALVLNVGPSGAGLASELPGDEDAEFPDRLYLPITPSGPPANAESVYPTEWAPGVIYLPVLQR